MTRLFSLAGVFLWLVATSVPARSQDGHWDTLQAKNQIMGRSECTMAAWDGKLYVIGGEGAANTFYLDPSSRNPWRQTDSLKLARNGMSAAVAHGKIYAFGGPGATPGMPGAGNLPTDSSRQFPQGGSGLQGHDSFSPLEVFTLNSHRP
jgi:hypothetical protein